MEKIYDITKKGYDHQSISLDLTQVEGIVFSPKNKIPYSGITVNKMLLINQDFIHKIVKKKAKKIDQYLNLMLLYCGSSEDDGTTYHHILNETSRFRDILKYRYNKYLEKKYQTLLLQKIEVLQGELIKQMIMVKPEKEKNGRKR